MKTETTTDGTTVWVNGVTGCIGRFTNRLAEVMADPATGFKTYQSTIGMAGDKNWAWFVETMLGTYGVVVPEDMRPKE